MINLGRLQQCGVELRGVQWQMAVTENHKAISLIFIKGRLGRHLGTGYAVTLGLEPDFWQSLLGWCSGSVVVFVTSLNPA